MIYLTHCLGYIFKSALCAKNKKIIRMKKKNRQLL